MNEKRKGAALLTSGILLAGVTFAGVFAAVIDTAKTGELSIESAEVPVANIDLKIDPTARSQGSTANCQTASGLVDDATTPYITITNANPGAQVIKDFCLRNYGTDPALITMDVIEASDIEIAGCSTTETTAGDTTCGAGLAGELAQHIDVGLKVHGALSGGGPGDTCDGALTATPEIVLPAVNTASPATVNGLSSIVGAENTLAADDAVCLQVRLTYDASTTEAEQLLAQTDKVSVRLRFNGED